MSGSDRTRLPASRWPILFCVPLGLLAAGLVYGAARLPGWLDDYLSVRSKLRALCVEANLVNMADAVACLGVLVAALCFAAATLGFVRRPWALRLIRAACFGCWLLGGVYLYVVHVATGLPLKYNLQVAGISPTACTQFFWRLDFYWPAFLIAAWLALLDLCTWRRAAMGVYFRRDDLPSQPGDCFLENLRTHGQEPQLRKWMYGSVMLHLSGVNVIYYAFTRYLEQTKGLRAR